MMGTSSFGVHTRHAEIRIGVVAIMVAVMLRVKCFTKCFALCWTGGSCDPAGASCENLELVWLITGVALFLGVSTPL